MKIKELGIDGKDVGNIEVSDSVFSLKPRKDIMGQRVGEGMTAPSFDLQRVMPQLIELLSFQRTHQ